ncbi:MAG: methylmalonyl Co-A mutase-associated GTPase MeaB [Bacteroidota bacterium]
MAESKKKRLTATAYTQGILAGDRITLSRAITLVESYLPTDQALAQEVMAAILPYTGQSVRVGITGVPGVGKSTFIETFGQHLTSLPKKMAVLTIDPSSQRSKGSILGDKTRMETLSHDPLAYIRPSPAGTSLGGVTRKTREAMLLCEAAGFEIILIETVGVGQSETAVRGMVDFFLLLMLAGAGDELQGIKKGIMEMADAIAITKADGSNMQRAKLAQGEYQHALHLFPPAESGWYPSVVTCSALENTGLADIWQLVERHHARMQQNGFFVTNRQQQQLQWMHETAQQLLQEHFYNHTDVKAVLAQISADVQAGKVPATNAAFQLLQLYRQ